MAFGQQSGPPASSKQVQYLQALLLKAGHTSFRDARGPLGLTQRQSSGKFTRDEATTLIDELLQADDGSGAEGEDGAGVTMEQASASDRIEAERIHALKGMPATLLADELERRGWAVIAPT